MTACSRRPDSWARFPSRSPGPPLSSQALSPWRRCQLSERLEHDYTESIAGSIQGSIY